VFDKFLVGLRSWTKKPDIRGFFAAPTSATPNGEWSSGFKGPTLAADTCRHVLELGTTLLPDGRTATALTTDIIATVTIFRDFEVVREQLRNYLTFHASSEPIVPLMAPSLLSDRPSNHTFNLTAPSGNEIALQELYDELKREADDTRIVDILTLAVQKWSANEIQPKQLRQLLLRASLAQFGKEQAQTELAAGEETEPWLLEMYEDHKRQACIAVNLTEYGLDNWCVWSRKTRADVRSYLYRCSMLEAEAEAHTQTRANAGAEADTSSSSYSSAMDDYATRVNTTVVAIRSTKTTVNLVARIGQQVVKKIKGIALRIDQEHPFLLKGRFSELPNTMGGSTNQCGSLAAPHAS
jgi:hypothetical protein